MRENQRFSDVFRGYRNVTLALNRLILTIFLMRGIFFKRKLVKFCLKETSAMKSDLNGVTCANPQLIKIGIHPEAHLEPISC